MLKPQVPVAKEGYPFIFFSGFLTLIFSILGCSIVTYIGLLVTSFILYFFRDPERFIPDKSNAIVSPADGKVILIEKIKDETFLNQDVFKISIFMNVFNVHVNRAPLSGVVEKIIHSPGKFYSADSDKGALQNENCATIITSETGVKIAFVQVAGLIARRIVNWLETDDSLKKGERFGLIRFGSRVDLYLPADIITSVEIGQKVRAGETIIGHLNQ
jgi:phosphatidylserine decarboxylase